MEKNAEIIQQLYLDIIPRVRKDLFNKPKRNLFTQYTVSARPSSLKTFNAFFSAISTAFPDFKLNIDNLVCKGDRVMARYTICGIHKGDFMGKTPTNKQTTIAGIDIFRLDNGKVVEHWDAAHQISALSQPTSKKISAGGNPGYRFSATVSDKKELSLSV
jgi:predicted ester cyclase